MDTRTATGRHCCKIGCGKEAEYEVDDGTPEHTDACLEHIPDLMTDAAVHRLYRLMPPLAE